MIRSLLAIASSVWIGVFAAAVVALCSSCGAPARRATLGSIYDRTAQTIGAERTPVVVIPGILGSRLVEPDGRVVWGAFTYGATDTDFPDGARVFALPMREGVALRELTDDVTPDGVLDSLPTDVGPLRVTALEPYRGIIASLAAGRYVDRDIATSGAARRAPTVATGGPVDYAGGHFTCFQFDYDWRRDVSEQAERLEALLDEAQRAACAARGRQEPVKVDVVAHSMGGLVLMYYLRYGTQPLPDDGSLPPLTWAGAARVRRAVLVGTPSAGSVLALKQLVEGVSYSPITPTYQPAVLCTMPSVCQLLPRVRHSRVVDTNGAPVDFFNVETWRHYRWGPFAVDRSRTLQWLLPDEPDASARERVAMDHLAKCLARARQFHAALDAPSTPPEGLELHLFAGDSELTPGVLEVRDDGRLRVRDQEPGDVTVTRASALLDERMGGEWSACIRTPIPWTSVTFLPANHIDLTSNESFTDNLLWHLLERP